MHVYATDSQERRFIPFLLAGLALAAAWASSAALMAVNISLPWWFEAPSALGFYGALYWLFDTHVWRWPVWRGVGLVRVPALAGTWRGYVTTSFDEHAEQHPVLVKIEQSWRKVSVTWTREISRSHSLTAAIYTQAPEGRVLTYQYQSDPAADAPAGMEIHYGTARLTVQDKNTLTGRYYSGRGRQTIGTIHLKRE